jgi:hypothetical protein
LKIVARKRSVVQLALEEELGSEVAPLHVEFGAKLDEVSH